MMTNKIPLWACGMQVRFEVQMKATLGCNNASVKRRLSDLSVACIWLVCLHDNRTNRANTQTHYYVIVNYPGEARPLCALRNALCCRRESHSFLCGRARSAREETEIH